ncbi:MAG: hypothetical protein MZV63_45625 [Marinilabiliales bacterium]|nr:hypothetical protein [Marinilabiliales bacterium]
MLTQKWRGVDITLLTTEKGLKIADNQFAAVIYALEYLDARVGPYPWPHLTFVDPPVSGSGRRRHGVYNLIHLVRRRHGSFVL